MRRWLRPTFLKRVLFFVFADTIASLLTLYLAYLLRFNFHIPDRFLTSFWHVYMVLIALKLLSIHLFKGYFIVWRFFGLSDAKNLFKAHTVAYFAFIVFYLLNKSFFVPFPRAVIAIDFVLSFIVLGGIRSIKRLWLERRGVASHKPTVVIGGGSQAAIVIQSALRGDIDYYPVAVTVPVRDDSVESAYINGIKVYGIQDLERVIQKYGVQAAVLTEGMSQSVLTMLVEKLGKLGITEIKKVQLIDSNVKHFEDLSIEDLLARRPQDLDKALIARFVRDKKIIVTGAGGSIGREIVKQCVDFGAKFIVLVDNAELNLYQISETIPDAAAHLVDVSRYEEIASVIRKYRPDIVIHAAAYKHVPLCERNPEAAVRNNVVGTKNVIDASIASGVGKVVIISTDKAVRPTNIMGATKRVAELYAQNVPSEDTEIVAVRFGNVLGSSGSVIPKFKAQIESGGPVTVTHPDMTRYFMLIPEACQLVLQAAAIAKGGEIFILDMGSPVKIVDLARQMIRLYGKEGEVEIVFSGVRPGEKLHEELLIEESEAKTRYDSITVARATSYSFEALQQDIAFLIESEDKVAALQAIVAEYRPEESGNL